MKNIFRFFMLFSFILFMSLYLAVGLGFYKPYVKKYSLTENAIKRYDNDIKNHKEINTDNYIIKDSNYSNFLSRLFLSLSNFIGRSFRNINNKIFSEASKMVDE